MIECVAWRIDQPAPLQPDYADILSEEELARADRFAQADHRLRYLKAHYGVRRRLAERLGVPAKQLEFSRGPHGKPQLKTGRAHLNLSHTRTWAVLTFSDTWEVGVDIEGEDRSVTSLATSILSPAERDQWRMVDEPLQNSTLLEYWTAKEAVLKAVGVGLFVDPCTVTVERIGQHWQLQSLPDEFKVSDPIWLAPIKPAPDVCGFVAVIGPQSRPSVTLDVVG